VVLYLIQVLGIPWDVDTEGLRQFMSKYGELSDVIVMKVRMRLGKKKLGFISMENKLLILRKLLSADTNY
jgi:hypothetical protein